ncbi:MAG TPA: TonB-dependent receptor [Bacteroidota bacterium]|nr:TonB-dependent receptor [Bacteroidota bacterium]
MVRRICAVLVVSCAITVSMLGQQERPTQVGLAITGRIFDASTKAPLEYSNAILFDQTDSAEVTGTATNKLGKFTLQGINPGSYYLYVQLIGYATKKVNGISVSASAPMTDLGSIYLKPTNINLKDVVIEGRRSPITYQLDKRVVDVSQMHTAVSGTAANVLENVPSVSVDVDGNVSLRGSTNFQVLIDGRPSVMSAQDALQQVPASSIQNIEIMTNPSAKYDATGSAGIINIVLKRNSNLGSSGIVELMGGLADKYAGDFLYQYKAPSISYNVGLDFNRRSYPGTNKQDKQFINVDTTSYLNSNGTMLWQRILSSIRAGVDFDVSENQNISLGGSYGSRAFHRNSTLNYDQWSTVDPNAFYYLNNTNHNHSGNYYDLNSSYDYKPGRESSELSGEVSFRHNSSNEASTSIATENSSPINGTNTTELGPQNELRGKFDYTLPLSASEKFEAGSEFFSRVSQDINKLYTFDSTDDRYDFQSLFSNTNDFNRTRFAAYSILSNQWDSLSVQVGARAEYTYQRVKLEEIGQQFSLNQWNFFPSVHTSLNFAGGSQVTASFTRRIERPDGGDLEPFYTWIDANNVHIGNPTLKPELIDSYETGFQTYFGAISLSDDYYCRFTHDKMEDINSVYADNITLRTVANVGTDRSLGTEIAVLCNPVKLWELNLMGDVYDYKIYGAVVDQSFSRESVDWSIKNNNSFKLSSSTSLQVNVRYYSPSVSAQGKWGEYFSTDIALKHDIIPNALSLTFQIDDALKTDRREFTSQGVDFYNYNYYSHQSPIVMLNLKYNFNNFKEEKQSSEDQQDNGMGNE